MRFLRLLFIALTLIVCIPQPTFAADEESELFLVAQRAFEDGFYDVSIRYIEDFQSKYPQSERTTQAQLLLGQCYFFKNQFLKAFEIFQKLTSSTEYKDAVLFWMGETYLKGGDYTQAEEQYKQLIRVYPESIYVPQAYYSWAWVYFEQKEFSDAEEIYQEFIEKFPQHELAEDAHLKIAECKFNDASYQAAIEAFDKYLNLYPRSTKIGQAHFNMAEAYYNLENYADALTHYQAAQANSFDNQLILTAKISQGWAQLKLKDYPGSQAAFDDAEKMALEKNILSDEIYLGRGNLFTEEENYEQALINYQELLTKFPESQRRAEASLGIANIYYIQQNYPQAIDAYKQVIEKKDHFPPEVIEKAYFGLAWTYLKEGKIDESIQSFNQVIGQTADDIVKVSAYTQIGDAYQDLNELQKAIDVYDKILKDYPESIYSDYVQYRQAIALLKQDKIDAAMLSFQSLQGNFPNSKYVPDVDYYLGIAHYKKNDWKSAISYLEKFISSTNHSDEFTPEANYILGLSYASSSQPQAALKIFTKILRLYTQDPTLVRNTELQAARAYYATSDTKEALKRFKLLIFKYPQTPVAFDGLLWLAQYYFKNADYVTAQGYYQQLIDQFPGSEFIDQIHFELGQVYEAQGILDKALNEYKAVSNKNQEIYVKAGLAIAQIFSKELDSDQAVQTYQTIIENSPDFKRDAYLKIAHIYRSSQDFAKEIETYQQALTADRGRSQVSNAEIYFNLGDSYEIQDQLDQATEMYLKISYLHEDELDWMIKAYLRLGRIFETKSDWEGARRIYERIIAFNTEESKFAQERMDTIAQEHPVKKR